MKAVVLVGFSTTGKSSIINQFRKMDKDALITLDSDKQIGELDPGKETGGDDDRHIYNVYSGLESGAIGLCWGGSQAVGAAPDENCLNNIEAADLGVQCCRFRSQGENLDLFTLSARLCTLWGFSQISQRALSLCLSMS